MGGNAWYKEMSQIVSAGSSGTFYAEIVWSELQLVDLIPSLPLSEQAKGSLCPAL